MLSFMKYLLSVCAILIACSTQIQAQMWTRLSPLPSQVVPTIATVGSVLYAGTSEGLYRSVDKGQSWENIGDFNNRTIVNLSVHNNELFVCPVSAGVWSFANNQWKDLSSNLPLNTTVYAVIRKGNTLFAGTNTNGVYRSENNGATWDVVGLPNLDVRSVVLIDTTIFAGALDFEGSKGSLFRSEDNGQSWIRSDTGLASTFSKIIAVRSDAMYVGTLGSGVFRSSDKGKSWTEVSNGLSSMGINSMVAEDDYILTGTDNGGIFISRDSAKVWRDANYKLLPRKINDLLIFDKIPYCATNDGVWSCDLSVNSVQENDFDVSKQYSVYPQPIVSNATVILPNQALIRSASLVNVLGTSVDFSYEIVENRLHCALVSLSAGTYFVRVQTTEGFVTIPIVKQ